ncbi:MAG: L,D-transpeptidase, partial [Chloroflexaceae bacterium]|nr:L,D-transpeptidase [Chloroflexaceae bacterium]
ATTASAPANRYSHGCVGIAPHDAGLLFGWAPEGTLVTVR